MALAMVLISSVEATLVWIWPLPWRVLVFWTTSVMPSSTETFSLMNLARLALAFSVASVRAEASSLGSSRS